MLPISFFFRGSLSIQNTKRSSCARKEDDLWSSKSVCTLYEVIKDIFNVSVFMSVKVGKIPFEINKSVCGTLVIVFL